MYSWPLLFENGMKHSTRPRVSPHEDPLTTPTGYPPARPVVRGGIRRTIIQSVLYPPLPKKNQFRLDPCMTLSENAQFSLVLVFQI